MMCLCFIKELGKIDKMMRGLPRILSPFHKAFNKSDNAAARMMDSVSSYIHDVNRDLSCENNNILPNTYNIHNILYIYTFNGRHFIRKTTKKL